MDSTDDQTLTPARDEFSFLAGEARELALPPELPEVRRITDSSLSALRWGTGRWRRSGCTVPD